MHQKEICLFLLLIHITSVTSAKFLLLGMLFRSHQIEILSVGSNLAQHGHTVYNALPQDSPSIQQNYKSGVEVLTFDAAVTLIQETAAYGETISKMVFEDRADLMESGEFMIQQSQKHCQAMLSDSVFMAIVTNMDFDLVIVDAFILDYCLFVIPQMLSLPYIAISGTLINYWSMGIPALPSISPGHISCVSSKQTFLQRLMSMFDHILLNARIFPATKNKVIEEYAPGFHDRTRFLQNARLFIVTLDHHLEFPGPSMPDTIFLPGITYTPAKPLPSNILHQIGPIKQGLIVFSFGSIISGSMPLSYIKVFLDAFEHFPEYTIAWKFPNETLLHNAGITAPSNVVALPWLPQIDILGHSKTRLFITHCGNNGQYEALHHGVPMIGFPLFAEQKHNAFRMVEKGFGLAHDIYTVTTDDLVSSMDRILHEDHAFRENAQKMSNILKAFPVPQERARFWIEHIVKYGNIHLRSHARDLPIHQLLSLDLAAGIVLFLTSVSLISLYWFKKLFCYFKKGVSDINIQFTGLIKDQCIFLKLSR